jgi:deoxyribonuclease V
LKLHEKSDGIDKAESYFFSSIQKFMKSEKSRLPAMIDNICGVDASYRGKNVVAVASLFINGELRETGVYSGNLTFPYVTGLLYLHEGPFAIAAIKKLRSMPQLICFDGHGLAHPRSMGLATICGMVIGIPSIGICKSPLVGRSIRYKEGLEKIIYKNRTVGFVSRFSNKPRYLSPGYSVNLRELESIMQRYGHICLKAMEESDRFAKKEITKA